MRLQGTLFEKRGVYGTRVEQTFDVPWEQGAVRKALTAGGPAEDKEKQQLWSAALYEVGATRGVLGLQCNTALQLDKDCGDVGDLLFVREWLRARGQAYVIYTSWSHGSTSKKHKDTGRSGPFDCFRVVLPLSRHATPEEYRCLVQGVYGYEVPFDPPNYATEVAGRYVQTKGGRSKAALPRGWDATACRPAQGYFVPAPHSWLELSPGLPVDVSAVLARPQTPRVKHTRARTYSPPTAQAQGALGTIQVALERQGFGWQKPTAEGWHRATCPVCQSSSPSLTARANGEGLELHCWAACRRADILGALGLPTDGIFGEGSEVRTEVEEQLSRQSTNADPVPVNVAVVRLEEDIREALRAYRPTVIQYPAGTGKSHASAKVLTEYARQGETLVYATQEHAVAHETRSKLPPDILARSVHIHSPLVQVGNDAVCLRKAEVEEAVFEYGLSLLGQVCPRCPYKDDCEARAQARQRQELLPDASIVFVSHAGIGQLFGGDKGHGKRLIVDEMPSAYDSVSLSIEMLRTIANGAPMPSAALVPMRLAQEYAKAWALGRQVEPLTIGTTYLGKSEEILRDFPRMRLQEKAHPRDFEKPYLRAADAVLRIASWEAEGGKREISSEACWAMIPTAAHQALVQSQGVLLSATPLLLALPGFDLKECAVKDSAEVRRICVPKKRGSYALKMGGYDDETGSRGGTEGVDWPALDQALARARAEADRYEVKRVLFVTFKHLADALREQPDRLGQDIEVAHYGALRGKNDWMEGRAHEVSVVYCYGTPRFDLRSTLQALGCRGQSLSENWAVCAAGELTQAEGRLRLPRRKKPCSVVVEGDVVPTTWTVENFTSFDEGEIETPSGLIEEALVLRNLGDLAALGFPYDARTGTPQYAKEALRSLRYRLGEAMDLLNKTSPGRQRKLLEALDA